MRSYNRILPSGVDSHQFHVIVGQNSLYDSGHPPLRAVNLFVNEKDKLAFLNVNVRLLPFVPEVEERQDVPHPRLLEGVNSPLGLEEFTLHIIRWRVRRLFYDNAGLMRGIRWIQEVRWGEVRNRSQLGKVQLMVDG